MSALNLIPILQGKVLQMLMIHTHLYSIRYASNNYHHLPQPRTNYYEEQHKLEVLHVAILYLEILKPFNILQRTFDYYIKHCSKACIVMFKMFRWPINSLSVKVKFQVVQKLWHWQGITQNLKCQGQIELEGESQCE